VSDATTKQVTTTAAGLCIDRGMFVGYQWLVVWRIWYTFCMAEYKSILMPDGGTSTVRLIVRMSVTFISMHRIPAPVRCGTKGHAGYIGDLEFRNNRGARRVNAPTFPIRARYLCFRHVHRGVMYQCTRQRSFEDSSRVMNIICDQRGIGGRDRDVSSTHVREQVRSLPDRVRSCV
jgi:hypothetical protein